MAVQPPRLQLRAGRGKSGRKNRMWAREGGAGCKACAVASGTQGRVIVAAHVFTAKQRRVKQKRRSQTSIGQHFGCQMGPAAAAQLSSGDGVPVGPSGPIYAGTAPLANLAAFSRIAQLCRSRKAPLLWEPRPSLDELPGSLPFKVFRPARASGCVCLR